MTFTTAIVGRPNVGKSTLFNRLAGRRLALVDKTPGLTRDRRQGEAKLGDLRFTVIDTAGLEEAAAGTLQAGMRAHTERALEGADVALFLVDARAGVTPLDEHFADWLRRTPLPVVVVANKCEGEAGEAGRLEAYGLGLGEPVALSAEHGTGLDGLYDALAPFDEAAARRGAAETDPAAGDDAGAPLRLAVVGRPNVGKSTLVNRLLGEERVLTGPEPGVTRDAVSIAWTFRGRRIELIDTAGLRRRSRIRGRPETLSSADALRAVRFAHVVVLVVDAGAILERQDLGIARQVADEGRALVVAVNKWDLVRGRAAALSRIEHRLASSLPQVRGVPVVTLSALTGRGVETMLPAVLGAFEVWNRRLPTAALNRWLGAVVERHPPPRAAGRRVRLRYITQAKPRPPTFVLFANRPDDLPDSYIRYLVNDLRQSFELPGVPVRLLARKGRNPYAPA